MIRKWNRACSRWRKHCIRRLAQKFQRARRIRRVRTCLAAVLCAEVLTGAGMYWNQNRPELNLVRREEICEVELVPGNPALPVRMRLQKTRIFMVSGWIGKPWRFSFITGRM